MADAELLREAAKSGRGPAVQSGANDLGMFAPTPMGIATVGGALALSATAASATTGPATSGAASPSFQTDIGTALALGLPTAVQGSAVGTILPDISLPSGMISTTSPVAHESAPSAVSGSATNSMPSPAPVPQPASSDASPEAAASGTSPVTEVANISGAATSPQIIETIAAIRATADQLNEQLNGAINALVGRVGTNLDEAVSATSAAIGDIGSRVEAINGRIGEAVGRVDDLVDGAVGGLSQTIADLADTTDTLVGVTQASVSDATAAVAAQLDDATAAISDTVDSALDMADLGGGDPAGGIATLTALLSSTEGFELGDPDLPEPVFASVGQAASVLEGVGDTVGDLALPDVPGLLGNQGGLLSGLFDDDGDGHG